MINKPNAPMTWLLPEVPVFRFGLALRRFRIRASQDVPQAGSDEQDKAQQGLEGLDRSMIAPLAIAEKQNKARKAEQYGDSASDPVA